MLRQDITALQPLQQQEDSVDNAAGPVKSSSSLQQQLKSMPSTLSEALHEFYRAHTQLEPHQHQQQQQPPPLVRGPPPSAPPNVLANIMLANERLSASVTRSHSRDRSVSEAPVETHRDGNKDPHSRQGQAVRPYTGKIRSTVAFSREGERESSASQVRSASPPDSIATAAPPLRPEVPITTTLDVDPTQPLALLQDRRRGNVEARVDSHDRAAAARHPDPGVTSVAVPPSSTQTGANAAPHRRPSPSPEAAADDELQRTRQKLAEMQRLYSFEKRAHLQQRTRQLREEAQRRQSDDDITERTAQLLIDYESLIRFRDTASREHLEGVLQRVTAEWKRSAESLEQTRAACEDALLSRLHATLAEQQDALAKRLQQHLVLVAKSTVETERAQHAAIAAAVQEQVESFKEEYRRVLEQDMAERQRLMDEQAAHREAQWRSFLKDEHARMVATGEAAAREASRRQLETLHIAMRDITALREQLLHEHTRRQAQVGQEYLVAYEGLASEYVASTAETAEFVQRLQRDYASVIHALHKEVNRVSAEKQEAVRQSEQCTLQVAEAVAQQLHLAEESVDARWQARWAAEQEAHRAAVLRLTRLHEEALEKVWSASAVKEAKLKEEHEREHAAWEAHLTHQQEQQTAAFDDALRSAQGTVQRLEREKEGLSVQVQQLKDQLRREELAHEAVVQGARQAEEARYTSQLNSLEAAYDAVLQQYKEKLKTACNGSDGSGAGFTTATTAVKRVMVVEKELHEARAEHATQVQQAVEETAALWSARLEECRQQQRAHCKAMEQQHRALRAALLEEVQRREQALEESCVAERRAHQEELQNVITREKEASQRALERLERQHAAAQRQVEAEAERRVRVGEDALAAREKQLEIAEAEWQRRRTEDKEASLQQLTAHVAAQHAKQLAELEEQEAILRSEHAQLARQQAVMEQDIRRVVRGEMEMRLTEQLAAAEKGWMRLLEAELLQRFTTWQEFRMQELAYVQQLHREEMRLQDEHHAVQITALQDAQQRHLSQEAEAMRAREAAWAAARTASLDAYNEAVAAKLQEVLAVERAQWHTAQQQHAAERDASIETTAARVAEHFAITEATRAQLEEEVHASYLATLEQQQAKMSALLAEQRHRHEEAIAQVRASSAELAQQQAAQFEKDLDAREREHEAHVREVKEALERQLAAQRSQHAAALAAERSVARDDVTRLQQQADAAREAYENAASVRMQNMRRLHEQQIAELQQRCDAQARQLGSIEADSYLLEQRVRHEQEATLRAEYEESIAGLRNAIEERNRGYAELQASLYARVQAEADRIQAAADERVACFMQQQQKQLAELLLAHERALGEQQQRQQEELARLRAHHEVDLKAQACKLRKEHEATEAALQSQWEAQQESWQQLLEDERRDRRAADERATAAAADAAELRVAWEQQQAAAYRALDEQYRWLLEQMRSDMQVEREELARRCLEEEEHHFAAKMLQRQHAHRQPPQAQPQQKLSVSTHSFPTPDAPILVAAPESRTPLDRRRSSGAATMTLSTPAAPCSATSQGSPLLISPAAPVELPAAHHHHSHHHNHEQEPHADLVSRSKQRLRQLWDVLEVPSADQRTFLNYADSLAQEAPAAVLQDALLREQRRLEAQLPLLEALTRREYVQRQLRALANVRPLAALSLNSKSDAKLKRWSAEDGDYDTDDALHVSVSAPSPSVSGVLTDGGGSATTSAAVSPPAKMRGKAEGTQLEQLQLELQRLTVQLRRDITQHEKEYGQLFCVHGTRVMDTL
ncbi:conserved hypothetical protein [Leishmania major strain Friedlin]|uniref:Uncharacterized protein n=1 Tax=Leishmania major TaxID=5664 RepID=Q4QC81_LEIMA|nr:conserved hypothetical protein [Leishmania major strain Friedlin]CAG9573498.1 hypothetical_protein_-_conserved [Leishmania major strain Friedlin]CAJ04587.1 conserved hypothetical protein [Leishmania major strain Friedlin]|eukprot:XP_001683067.1 conserved hypothetical protein [Leishmania major strain Friedlin]